MFLIYCFVVCVCVSVEVYWFFSIPKLNSGVRSPQWPSLWTTHHQRIQTYDLYLPQAKPPDIHTGLCSFTKFIVHLQDARNQKA